MVWSGVLGAGCAILLIGSSAGISAAQTPDGTTDDPEPRRFAVAVGFGNSLGWLGGQAEYYARDRLSIFTGLGHTLLVDKDDPSGPTVAVGVRGYSAGVNHRGLIELSYSQVSVRAPPGDRLYGPGLQVGYQHVTDGGFTFLMSVGVGIEMDDGAAGTRELTGVSVGYTWR